MEQNFNQASMSRRRSKFPCNKFKSFARIVKIMLQKTKSTKIVHKKFNNRDNLSQVMLKTCHDYSV